MILLLCQEKMIYFSFYLGSVQIIFLILSIWDSMGCGRAGAERSSTTCSVWWDPWVHNNSNKPFLWWQCTQGSSVRWWVYLHWYIDNSVVNRSFSFGSWVARFIIYADAPLQDVKTVPIFALTSFKLKKILGGQGSTPSRVAPNLSRMPLIVGETFKCLNLFSCYFL